MLEDKSYLFSLDQEKEILEHFNEYGFVAIKDILTVEECKLTYEEIGKQMNEMEPKFNIHDTSTYDHMPGNLNYGMHANDPIFSEQFLMNRQNERVHKAFSIIYGTKDIIVNHDRCCFYRPTKNILINGTKCDKPEWRISYNYPGVHLDFHPSSYRESKLVKEKKENISYKEPKDFMAENNLYCEEDGLELQAIINLLNNREEDGGFTCIPGFVKKYDEWLKGYLENNKNVEVGSYKFSDKDKSDMKYVHSPVRISVPKGAIIIWNQKMAHGSKPNNSDRPRCAMFLKAMPMKFFSKEKYLGRQKLVTNMLKINKFNKISETGKIMFGLNNYKQNQ
jgi:hypothetical protein